MPHKFRTEIREIFEKKYVKIFLLNMDEAKDVQVKLEELDCLKKINISNDGRNLTAYPNKMYMIEETQAQIEKLLSCYFADKNNVVANLEITKNHLMGFPKSKMLYDEALENIKKEGSNRNTLDSLRLALEKLLQDIVGNNATLEKQRTPLSDYLKSKGVTPEIKNTIINSLDNLWRYQDNHVKHDCNIKEEEVCFVVNLTNNIVEQLLKYK